MKKEWFFDRVCGEQIVVYAEDGKVVELEGENEKNGAVLGNIYKGKVANVVPGMQAAFINCGMARNCYLPLDEGAARFASYDGSGSSSVRDLKEGDEVARRSSTFPRRTFWASPARSKTPISAPRFSKRRNGSDSPARASSCARRPPMRRGGT